MSTVRMMAFVSLASLLAGLAAKIRFNRKEDSPEMQLASQEGGRERENERETERTGAFEMVSTGGSIARETDREITIRTAALQQRRRKFGAIQSRDIAQAAIDAYDQEGAREEVLGAITEGTATLLLSFANGDFEAEDALQTVVSTALGIVGVKLPLVSIVASVAVEFIFALFGGDEPSMEEVVQEMIDTNNIQVALRAVREDLEATSEEATWTLEAVLNQPPSVYLSFLFSVNIDLARLHKKVFYHCIEEPDSDTCQQWQEAGTVSLIILYVALHLNILGEIVRTAPSLRHVVTSKIKDRSALYRAPMFASLATYDEYTYGLVDFKSWPIYSHGTGEMQETIDTSKIWKIRCYDPIDRVQYSKEVEYEHQLREHEAACEAIEQKRLGRVSELRRDIDNLTHQACEAANQGIVDAYKWEAGHCGNIAKSPVNRGSQSYGTRVPTVHDGLKAATDSHVVLRDQQVAVKMNRKGYYCGSFKYTWKNKPPYGSYSFAYSTDGETFTGLKHGYSTKESNGDYGDCAMAPTQPFGPPNSDNTDFMVPAPADEFLWFSIGYPGGDGAQLIEIEWIPTTQIQASSYSIDSTGYCFPDQGEQHLCGNGQVAALNDQTCDGFTPGAHPAQTMTDDEAQTRCDAEPNCDGYTRWYNGHSLDGQVRFQKGITGVQANSQTKCYRKAPQAGYCFVRIHGDTTGNCGSMPKNLWVLDDNYGGTLGSSATYASCSARGWANFCGTSADYEIREAAKYTVLDGGMCANGGTLIGGYYQKLGQSSGVSKCEAICTFNSWCVGYSVRPLFADNGYCFIHADASGTDSAPVGPAGTLEQGVAFGHEAGFDKANTVDSTGGTTGLDCYKKQACIYSVVVADTKLGQSGCFGDADLFNSQVANIDQCRTNCASSGASFMQFHDSFWCGCFTSCRLTRAANDYGSPAKVYTCEAR